ncbi:MAG: VWA domain-containing protein, partial [Dehalococcoidia bacterium]|nr:VWA domain-containing protein [Dehalococcoidia bacterium]
MTLALYGKSRRRQLALITIGVFVALAAMAAGLSALTGTTPAQAAPTPFFSDSFGTSATNTVPAPWADSDGSGSYARVTSFSGAPSSHFLDLEESEYVTAPADSTGYEDISISFYCRGDSGNDNGDDLGVWYNAGSGWILVATYDTNGTSGSHCREDIWQAITVDLSGLAVVENNPSLQIGFSSSGHSGNNENVYVDEVVVRGEPLGPSGTITIIKDTSPNANDDFDFSTTGGLTPGTFQLDDNSGGSLPNTQTFTNVPVGAYTVTEGLAANHLLTGLSCTDPDGGTTTDLGTRTASIDLDDGETVVCTFVNTPKPTPGDADGDGVPDVDDKCSATPGTAGLLGCPTQADLLATLPNGTPNPNYTSEVCGEVNFQFVIDGSGSMEDDRGTLKTQINSFVTNWETDYGAGLAKFGGVVYSGENSATILPPSGYSYIQSGAGNDFNDSVQGLGTFSGRTPTSVGINTAAGNILNRLANRPDILFVFADGSPNEPSSLDNASPLGWYNAAAASINAADAARADNVSAVTGIANQFLVFSIFIGEGDTSGPFPDMNAWGNGVMQKIGAGTYYQTSVSGLEAALRNAIGCPPDAGELIVKKLVIGDDTGAPAFTGSVSGEANGWSLASGADTGAQYQETAAGTHTVTEDDPGPDWQLEGYTVVSSTTACLPNPTTFDSTGPSVDVNVPTDGSVVVCVYNSKVAPPTGTISGSKYQDLDGNGGNETTNPLSGWTFNLIDAGQNTV